MDILGNWPQNRDCTVVDRDALDDDIRAQVKPWLVEFADGTLEEFDTEDDACACQREYRVSIGRDPMTGEEI